MDEKCIAFLSLFWKVFQVGFAAPEIQSWNLHLCKKLCLWGRWQLLLTKYPKVSVEVRIISCILFWSQEKLASNPRSSLQKRKIRNSQIQAEAAPLFLVWLHFSIFTVKWHKVPSSGKRIYLSQRGVSRMLRGGSAAVERAPECVLAVRHCLESQESLVEFKIILDSSLFAWSQEGKSL